MKALVTGGAGFIGSHLVDKLIEEGNKVIVLDNLSSGKLKNVNHKARFVKGDIRDTQVFRKIPKDIEVVFHLAALTDARESIEKPDLYFDLNVNGSFNVLEFCRKTDAKIIFTSSAAVYGDYDGSVKETDVCKPLSPYGQYKLIAEELIKSYNEFYGLPYTIFRIFNVYGSKANSGVIKKLIDSGVSHKPFNLYGNGEQRRDFIFVEDVIKVILQYQKIENTTLNVGTGKSTSILELIDLVNSLGYNLKIIKKKEYKSDIKLSCSDISKLRNFLPEHQFTTLKNGLLSCINPK